MQRERDRQTEGERERWAETMTQSVAFFNLAHNLNNGLKI